MYTPKDADLVEMGKRFNYHPARDDQPSRHCQVREACKATATLLLTLCPPSRELSVALTKLQEAMMWGNAAISCNEKPPG